MGLEGTVEENDNRLLFLYLRQEPEYTGGIPIPTRKHELLPIVKTKKRLE